MDHLPRPPQPCHANLEVPYLVKEGLEYDGQGIEGYASRRGFDLDLLRQGDLSRHTAEDTLSFLQSWLFFGLIIDIFKSVGIDLASRDFIRASSDGTRIITTKIFPQLVIGWEVIERNASATNRAEHLKRIDACLSHAQYFIAPESTPLWNHNFFVDEHVRDNIHGASAGGLLHLSVLLLGEALRGGRHTVYRDRKTREPSTIGGGAFSDWGSYRLLDRLLLNSGWCPFEVETWRSRGENSTRLYFSNLIGAREPGNHAECTKLECKLNAIDKNAYNTLHIDESCQCVHCYSVPPPGREDIVVLGESAATIFGKGHIPLVVVSGPHEHEILTTTSSEKQGLLAWISHMYKNTRGDAHTTWLVKNSDAKPRVRYVAISHVWRGGLGNPHQNSLPRCQLARIQALVNGLYSEDLHPVPFWIDTLCVPLEQSLRNLAIKQTKSVYQEADKVLVLDSALRLVSLPSSPVESLLRIACSSWMQRLWTFQEGILAFQLVFQFLDVSVSGEDLIRQQDAYDREFYNAHFKDVMHMLWQRCDRTCFARTCNFLHPGSSGVDHPWTGRGAGLPNTHDTVTFEAKLWFKEIRIRNSFHTHLLLHPKRPHEMMSEFSRSLSWRRTTRMEDESLVLANLLGLDTRKLLDARNELTMKLVFQNMTLVPEDVLFVPREHLSDQGCSWMPVSLINGGYGSGLSNNQATVTKTGLMVYRPGLLLEGGLTLTQASRHIVQVDGVHYSINISYFQSDMANRFEANRGAQLVWAILLKDELNRYTKVKGALLSDIQTTPGIVRGQWSGVVVCSPLHDTFDASRVRHIHISKRFRSQHWCVT